MDTGIKQIRTRRGKKTANTINKRAKSVSFHGKRKAKEYSPRSMSRLTTYNGMQCIVKEAWLPGPLYCCEEKRRTGNKVGDRVKTPVKETNL